jgi:uncharacterized DUF497 family protein
VRYTFEWDPAKAAQNWLKHHIGFDAAAELFLDPLAISCPDDDHSDDEERWVTLGKDARGRLLLLIHTFSEFSSEEVVVRIISARKATKNERQQYHESL